jgi:hypothetical protein
MRALYVAISFCIHVFSSSMIVCHEHAAVGGDRGTDDAHGDHEQNFKFFLILVH